MFYKVFDTKLELSDITLNYKSILREQNCFN